MSITSPLQRIDGTRRTTPTAVAVRGLNPQKASPVASRSQVARRAIRLACYGALACLISVFLLVAMARVSAPFGYHSYTVANGSMEPTLKRGSVAVAARTSPQALRVGDIIAYHDSLENPPVLHRIVEIADEGGGQMGFITQGDRNQTPDSHPVSLQGPGDRVLYTVPYAGYVLDFADSTQGRVLLIGLPAPVLLALFLVPGKRTGRSRAKPTRAIVAQGARAKGRPPQEAQAIQGGPLAAGTQPGTPGVQPRPSLEAQAIQRGLLRAPAAFPRKGG